MIVADLNNCIWDNIRFCCHPGFTNMPNSSQLEELITYAVLEGPRPNVGEKYELILEQEEGYDPEWTWADNVVGKVINTFTFTTKFVSSWEPKTIEEHLTEYSRRNVK